jgi:hypothetical protein
MLGELMRDESGAVKVPMLGAMAGPHPPPMYRPAPDVLSKMATLAPEEAIVQSAPHPGIAADLLERIQKAEANTGSEVSTRVPKAVSATEDPLQNILSTSWNSWRRGSRKDGEEYPPHARLSEL